MTRPDDPDHPVVREDEDDYDLLTFGEAGARLDAEIRRLAGRIRQLEEAADESAELAGARAPVEQPPGGGGGRARGADGRARPAGAAARCCGPQRPAADQRRELRALLRLCGKGAPEHQ